jgi:hypothetical protein
LSSVLIFLGVWALATLLVYHRQCSALARIRDAAPYQMGQQGRVFVCAFLGLLISMGTMVVGTFAWHRFMA